MVSPSRTADPAIQRTALRVATEPVNRWRKQRARVRIQARDESVAVDSTRVPENAYGDCFAWEGERSARAVLPSRNRPMWPRRRSSRCPASIARPRYVQAIEHGRIYQLRTVRAQLASEPHSFQ
jgi:hypothetical protein